MPTAEPNDSRNERSGARTGGRRPLIVNPHRKLRVWLWVIPLVIIVAVILLLPHILERFI